MKILHIIAQRPGRTGSGIFLNSLIEQASHNNFPQAVIAGIPDSEKLQFPQIDSNNCFPVHFETPELPFPIVGMSDVMPYPSTKYSDLKPSMLSAWISAFERMIKLAVEQFEPDIIFSHHLWMLTALARRIIPDKPIIAFVHGTGLRQLELATEMSEKVIEGCREIDLVLALNSFQKQLVHKKFDIPRIYFILLIRNRTSRI